MMGEVVGIHVAERAGGTMREVESAEAVTGRGLEGDRYSARVGFYSDVPSPGGGREVTLIEEETLDALLAEAGIRLSAVESRRNVTTRGIRLNDLVGKRFLIGQVVCEGVRHCPPCNRLEELTGKAVLGPLAHRGGLRANVLTGGTIHRGDLVEEIQAGS